VTRSDKFEKTTLAMAIARHLRRAIKAMARTA
jgi:hypothetical protein